MTKRGSIELARALCNEIAGEPDEDGHAQWGSVDIAYILSAEVVRLRKLLDEATQ